MTDGVNENLVPSSLHLSYVISITIPQPTIRIRIPKVLAKVIQRRNNRLVRSSSTQIEDDNGSSSNTNDKKKRWKKKSGTCKRSLRKKVGAMFSNVFGNKKSSSSPDHTAENSEVEGDDEVDRKVERSVVDTKEMVVKRTRKRNENNYLNGMVQETAVATGFGVSKSLLVKKETSEAGDEGKEGQQEQGSVSKSLSRRTINGVKKENISKANDDTVGNGDDNSSSVVLAGAGDSVGTTSRRATGKEESDELPPIKVPPVTRSSSNGGRKLKVALNAAWSVKKLMRKESGRQQLCNKRILMGGKCKPLGPIQYDENGFLLPEIIP